MKKDMLDELPGVLVEALNRKMVSDEKDNFFKLHASASIEEAKTLYETTNKSFTSKLCRDWMRYGVILIGDFERM